MKRTSKKLSLGLRIAGLLVICFGMSGCLAAIGPLLSLGGAVTAAPVVQVAAMGYSVGEYTYEYTVNDKTPDEVIEDKVTTVAALFSDEDAVQAPQSAEPAVMLAEADTSPAPIPEARAERVRQRIELRRLQTQAVQARELAFNKAVQDSVQLKWTPKRGVDLARGADGDVTLR